MINRTRKRLTARQQQIPRLLLIPRVSEVYLSDSIARTPRNRRNSKLYLVQIKKTTRRRTMAQAFGSRFPYADPIWYSRGISPYYNESHKRLREDVRQYVDTHITPFCAEWERQGSIPEEVGPPTFLWSNSIKGKKLYSPLLTSCTAGMQKLCRTRLHGCFCFPHR